uniref:Uncharacterized protein n=1 Tax=Opuntia streptacantha TaxID=393608 RepID=A0A7C8Z595_OPUST
MLTDEPPAICYRYGDHSTTLSKVWPLHSDLYKNEYKIWKTKYPPKYMKNGSFQIIIQNSRGTSQRYQNKKLTMIEIGYVIAAFELVRLYFPEYDPFIAAR